VNGIASVLALQVAPKLSWYIARASGIVSWILLAMSTLWGMLLGMRVLNRFTAPGWLLDFHRYLGALSIVFIGVHVGGLVGDNWLHIGWSEVLVPMASTYRPMPVAYGVAGLYLLVAIELTSLLKARIPRRVWRSVHLLSIPLFIVSTLHGIQAGTDVHGRGYTVLTLCTLTAIAVVLALRMTTAKAARSPKSPQRTASVVSEPAFSEAFSEPAFSDA
jgi:predicted ferric reductase